MFVNGDKSLITLLDSFPLTHLIQLEKQATVTVCNGLDNIELKVGLSLYITNFKNCVPYLTAKVASIKI